MKKLKYVVIVLFIAFTKSIIIAAPSDHGREYSFNSTNSFGFLELVGLVVLLLLIVFYISMFFKNLFDNDSQNSINNSTNKRKEKSNNPINYHTELCFKCDGKGWIKGEELSSRNCFTCGGTGHIPSAKALSLYKEYQERKRPQSDENRRFTAYKAHMIYSEYKKELEKCPPCPDCIKNMNIDESNIFVDIDGRKYTKVICNQCKGTGWTQRYLN